MSAKIIDGRAVAARVRDEVTREVARITDAMGQRPGLATILVGDDPASAIYVANKRKACGEVGIEDHHQHLDADASQDDIAALIEECNHDPDVTSSTTSSMTSASLLTGMTTETGSLSLMTGKRASEFMG